MSGYQLKTMMVYTDCAAKRGGDYTAAAKVAWAISKQLEVSDVDKLDPVVSAGASSGSSDTTQYKTQVVLVSSSGGVDKFQSMYPSTKTQHVNINGKQIKVYDLAAAAEWVAGTAVHYIEVGFCQPCPLSDYAKLTRNLAVHVTHIPLASYPLSYYDGVQGDFTGRSTTDPSRFRLCSYGFGEARKLGNCVLPPGYATSIGRVEPPASPFSFCYFASYLNLNKIISSFQALTARDNATVVIVGNDETIMREVTDFTKENPGVLVTVDLQSKGIFIYFNGDLVVEVPETGVTNQHRVFAYSSLAHDDFYHFMRRSLSVVSITGVESSLEAISLAKTLICESMNHNRPFDRDYISSFQELIRVMPYSSDAVEGVRGTLMNLFVATAAWSPESMSKDTINIIGVVNTTLLHSAEKRFKAAIKAICDRSRKAPERPVTRDSSSVPMLRVKGLAHDEVPKAPDTF